MSTSSRKKIALDRDALAAAVVEMVACTRALGEAWRANVHGMASDARGRLLHEAAYVEAIEAQVLAELLFPGLREYETKAAFRSALLTRVREPVERDKQKTNHQPG
jgi:hypothetical protein